MLGKSFFSYDSSLVHRQFPFFSFIILGSENRKTSLISPKVVRLRSATRWPKGACKEIGAALREGTNAAMGPLILLPEVALRKAQLSERQSR
jgi:hypothetical protein